MEIFSSLCRQWADQYLALSHQRKQLDDAMTVLKGLIISNGGLLPDPNNRPVTAPVAPLPAPEPMAPPSDYDTKGSWAYKIEYVLAPLQKSGATLPVADIATAINNLEPGLDLAKIIKAVTMEASKLGLNGRLGIKKKGNKNFYFLPKQGSLELELPGQIV